MYVLCSYVLACACVSVCVCISDLIHMYIAVDLNIRLFTFFNQFTASFQHF